MAENDVRLVVFDPFILRASVSKETTSVEYRALETLINHCPNKLVFDDDTGRLSGVYNQELRGQYLLVQDQLVEIMGSVREKLVTSKGRGVGSLQFPRRSHVLFARRALGIRPSYLVTEIPALLSVATTVQAELGTKILSAEAYIQEML